ncbi:MAG: hypothetical protein P8Y63_12645 [Deltaproteobacteria bacterium]|jgi:hypothetical protein
MAGGSGREMPMLIFIPAIVGTGTTIADAKNIIARNNFFTFLPPPSLYLTAHIS